MWISSEDIKTYSGIGKVLWLDLQSSRRSTLETLSVTSLMKKPPEQILERATQALLDCAKRDNKALQIAENFQALNHPFFRLPHEERLILVSLHQGRWSYNRLSRILNQSTEQIQETAWNARMALAPKGSYPHAPHPIGPSCPEFQIERPWTQRFLDQEISSGRDRVFLQQHLLSCSSCSSYLIRCREIYFNAEKEVAALTDDPEWVETLQQTVKSNPQPGIYERDLKSTLTTFFLNNRDIQWIVYIILSLVLFSLFKKVSAFRL